MRSISLRSLTPCAVLLRFQGARVLVLGDNKAFLAIYGVVSAAGLVAHQLDRSGGPLEHSSVAKNISKASIYTGIVK